MALTVNTNMYSVIAQNNLNKTQNPLMTAMQRLSSGLRINSAKDDAAGLAIATRMTRSINGLTVAARNANDGVSFAQTAEGSMGEMLNNLQRVYELANQAASYNTSVDRSSMNQEVSQLISELNRVVSQTRFNGETFLNRAFSGAFQVGIEVNETISIATTNVSPDAFGVQSTRTNFDDTGSNRT
ncbi:MAG: flagellin, partial [Candidatus Manganitrophaceae bacterium]